MPLEFSLSDDGTINTVISVYCPSCDRYWDIRFSDTSAYRDEYGGLDWDTFVDDMLSDEHCIYCDV